MIQEYAVGFLHNGQAVVLIQKKRPEWQYNLWNGVGGKVESGEQPYDAMVREFKEETGVLVRDWQHLATLKGDNTLVHCYAANNNGEFMRDVRTVTDEEIFVVPLKSLPTFPTVDNLKWLIPLALQRGKYKPVTVSFYGDS